MDLIYEGITTSFSFSSMERFHHRVRMDLIYEGITTSRQKRVFNQCSMSEWTWFTKGLRRHLSAYVIFNIFVRMDLIYEGITTIGNPSIAMHSV